MADILGLMNYIGQQGEAGIKKGEDRRLAGLYQQALQSPEQRQGAIAQMAGIRPQAAFDAQKHFEGMDDTARQRLGQYAAAFDALPEDMKATAYPQFAQQAQALGIPAPGEWKPEYAPNIQKLAQSFGGATSGTGVQSTFVDQQGNRIAVMRDGSVRNIGRAEDRFQMRDQPGIPLGAFDPRTGQIRAVQEAGAQSAPVSIDPNLPPAVQASIRANPEQWGGLPDGASVRVPGVAPTGAAASRPAVAPAEMARLQLASAANDRAEEANARAAEAARLAQRGSAPAGFRFKPDGSLEPIPGGPKPAGAAASEDERKAAAWLAQATNAFGNMQRALQADPAADDPGIIETYSPFEELGNRTRSDTRQQYVQAAESLSESLLRAATGAGINEHEAKQKVYELTPRRGDSDAVKRQKMAAIPVYLQALKARAGRAVPQQTQGGQVDAAPRRLKFNPATGRIE